MTEQRITIGVIGAGANTRKMHIPGLQAIDGVDIVSVCNRSVESGKRVADEFSIPQVHGSWREVIDDSNIDAIVIGTWPHMHKILSCAALNAGKHVLCEARMAMNAAEARVMWETSREHPSLVAQIVPSPFTLPFDQTIQEIIRDRRLGEIIAIDMRHATGGFPDYDSPMTWRQDIQFSGLNVMMMGIWYEALARWVGHARSVFARCKQVVKLRTASDGTRAAGVGIPDHVDIIADMDCGAQAHMQFSAVLGLAQPTAEIWIFGTQGTLRLDGVGKKLYYGSRGDQALTEVDIPEESRGQWRVEEEFINAIRGVETVKLTTLEEGVRYMEFTEAVSLSAATGKTVVCR
jgi:predicted dehydrogenase